MQSSGVAPIPPKQKTMQFSFFCIGGIGATPDDCTRQAAAKAHQRKLAQHPEALQLIIDQFGVDAYPKRVLMSEIPVGANIIPNEINNIPGFSVGEHYFMPGFPKCHGRWFSGYWKSIIPI